MNEKRGFTIIEILVSIGLFALIVPTLTVGIRNLVILNNRARDLALSSLIAENKIELLRSSGYNSLAIGTIDFTSELPNELGGPRSATYVVTSPSTGVKDILLTISYKDYGKTTSRSYRSAISELGIAQ